MTMHVDMANWFLFMLIEIIKKLQWSKIDLIRIIAKGKKRPKHSIVVLQAELIWLTTRVNEKIKKGCVLYFILKFS